MEIPFTKLIEIGCRGWGFIPLKIPPYVFCLFLAIFLFAYANYLPAEPPLWDLQQGADFPSQADYISFLQKFPIYGEEQWHGNYRGNPQLGYFGNGSHDHEEMRILSNFIFVYALLATNEGYDESVSGVGQDILLEHAKAAIRYFTGAHITGNIVCADGRPWGKQLTQWLTPWAISKATAGARLIWDELTQTEKDDIQRVVTYEANYQLKHEASSQEYIDTDAEYNALNGEVLAWASSLYSDHPRAQRWRSKAQEFFMNTFSVQSDRGSAKIVDGKPVSEWVYTTNVHPDFTMEGHGAYQFDYNATPLHSIAWSYYAFVSSGQPVPEALFHHVRDVWETLKRTHLYSGRFACPQGKDWARYVYGLYFIMPALVLFQNEFDDGDARLIEQLRFLSFQYEQELNVDGSIFGQRFGSDFDEKFQTESSGYRNRYETDCYANVGLAYLLHQYAPPPPAESIGAFQRKVEGTFHSEYCDFLYTRSKDLFISFSWKNLFDSTPMALFIPGDDHMAEWAAGNLIGYTRIDGFDMSRRPMKHNETILDSTGQLMGFTTTGHIYAGKRGGTYGIDHYLSFTALPTHGLAIIIEYLLAREELVIKKQVGLVYHLPNDIFNDGERQIYWENDGLKLSNSESRDTVFIDSKWINVDDKLGMVSLFDDGQFRIEAMRGRSLWIGMINEQISHVVWSESTYKAGDVVREQCYVLVGGDRGLTKDISESGVRWLETEDEFIKAAACDAGVVIANFHQEPTEVTVRFHDGKQITTSIPALETVVLNHPAGEAGVEVWQGGHRDDIKPVKWAEIKSVELFQNYPNPGNPDTWIPFQLPEESNVSISIYDIRGNLVRTLQLGQRKAGSYLSKKKAAHWDGNNETGERVASGIYFAVMKAGEHQRMRRMALIK